MTSVAIESTGVYWIPAYEILEQRGFEVILVNAQHAKNAPGRKTDVSYAAWLAEGVLLPSRRNFANLARPSKKFFKALCRSITDCTSGWCGTSRRNLSAVGSLIWSKAVSTRGLLHSRSLQLLLIKAKIVDEATAADRLPKKVFLLGGRIDAAEALISRVETELPSQAHLPKSSKRLTADDHKIGDGVRHPEIKSTLLPDADIHDAEKRAWTCP